MKKPLTISEYIKWANKTLSVDFNSERSHTIYETNIGNAYSVVSKHPFFANLTETLKQWESNYKRRTKSPLLMNKIEFDLQKKPYRSAIDKSFRKNVLWNKSFPKEPKEGWVTDNNLYNYFNDGLRGTLTCKFIDGPKFLVGKLTELANRYSIPIEWYTQEKDEGYYAYHFYTTFEVAFIDKTWQPQQGLIQVEIQLTTQLQDILRELTHQFYEQRRIESKTRGTSWKWNYKSNQFRASYLSHSLHLLEAYIVQARDDKSDAKRHRRRNRR
jgi:ppGpp synthetase/RelA/SpoT-type nucleotidyltranferase